MSQQNSVTAAGDADDGAQPLLVATVAAAASISFKPVGFRFRQVILGIRFVICLNRTRSPPVNQFIRTRSYTSVEIPILDEREIKKLSLKRIVKDKDFKALEQDFGGVQGVRSFLHSESEPQITANEDLEQSIRGLGFCGYLFLFSKGFWCFLWNSLNSCNILFLIIAADLLFAIGSLEQGFKYGWHDGVGILLAVFLLVFCPSVLNFYRKIAKEKEILKAKNKLEVNVKRGGECQMVSVSDVKEGEVIYLKKGDRVPADGLLIRGKNLIVDEEINPNIDIHRNPFLFSGSVVEYGDGDMIAVSIGADMAFGKGLLDVIDHPLQETLFQSRINKPYEFIEKFSLVVSLMILFVVLTRVLCEKHGDYYNDKPETKGKLTMGLAANAFEKILLKFGPRVSFLATVLLTMVIGIQHGMPFAITASLSLWSEKMRISHGGKCRNLSACGTLGLVSTICVDITGGLSFHEVEVEELLIGEEKINPDMEFHPDIHERFEQAARVVLFDSMASVPLRRSLLSSWENSGLRINLESLHQKFEIIDHKFLSSDMGFGVLMSKSSGDTEANLFHVQYYGDASTILNMCSQYYDIRGTIHDIVNQTEVLEKVINDMTTKGLRPIAFACKQTDNQVIEEEGLKLLGFVGLKYSCQKLKTALMDLGNIGVRIILTSEDELSVAINMADCLGIQCGSNNQKIEGEKFREIMRSDVPVREKNELMESITVMGKATLEDKLLLLKEWKATGKIVASLGGLTSKDSPTLIEADIGVALENRSTEISRVVSDLTCQDVTSLKHILKYGRCAYLNIQKFYQVQLTASISGLLITLICTMASGKSPLTTIHLIWLTFIMCLLGRLMMVMEELNDDDEEVKIALGGQPFIVITKAILKKIVIHVLSQVLIFLLLEYLGKNILPHIKEDVRHTMISNTFILCQIANLVGAMGMVTNGVAVLKVVLQSLWFLIWLVGVLAVQVMVNEFVGTVVNGVKLSAVQWTICFIFALTLELGLVHIIPLCSLLLNIILMFVFSVLCRFSVCL